MVGGGIQSPLPWSEKLMAGRPLGLCWQMMRQSGSYCGPMCDSSEPTITKLQNNYFVQI